jgi:CheY-specific phosphatase CheX
MNDAQWQGAVGSVRSNTFASTQKEVARSIASQNCLTVAQIRQLVEVFTFESDKLEMAKFCYDRCVEPQNYYMLNSVFTFESSVSELTNYVSGRR